MISLPLVQHVLLAALRDKLIGTLVLMIILGSCVSLFMGSAAVTEEHDFAVVLASGGLRFLGTIGLILFTSFYIRRGFETKEVEFLLSRPISRSTFLLSYAFAFIVLAAIVAFAVTAAIAIIGQPAFEGLSVWGISILIEFMLVCIIALFFSMVLSSAAGSALATLGFYVLGRMIGVLLGIAQAPSDGFVFDILGLVMEGISMIIPRLDAMGQTTWLVHGVPESVDLYWFAGQSLVLSTVFLAAASFDLLRKQF